MALKVKASSLIFAMLLLVVRMASLDLTAVNASTFTITNNCPYTINPGILTGEGSQASSTGFELVSDASSTVDVPAPWSGRVWARYECSDVNGDLTCLSGDCGSGQESCNGAGGTPPVTLAEFTIENSGGQDTYDVSLVDGFNLPLTVTPQGESGCSSTGCPVDINAQCPGDLSIENGDDATIGCKSACLAFNEPQYCCTGAYDSSATCKPTNYSEFFKNLCPQAYSYAYDDPSSTFTCTSGANYLITFCP